VAYFNTDVGVAGPDFSASAVPSLKQFLRELTRSVPSPMGGTVYQQWKIKSTGENEHRRSNAPLEAGEEVQLGDLGSGSDFTAFLQHIGVPATDIGSEGPYGVYHSVLTTTSGSRRRRPEVRLSAGDGTRLRPRSSAHGRCRRAPLQLRGLRALNPLLHRRG